MLSRPNFARCGKHNIQNNKGAKLDQWDSVLTFRQKIH